MPASFLGELIVAPLLEFVFHVVGYQVGRVTVAVLTLGPWRCDPFLSDGAIDAKQGGCPSLLILPPRKLGPASLNGPRWGGLYRRQDGKAYLPAEVTALIGMIVFLGMAIGVGYLSCSKNSSSAPAPAGQQPPALPAVAD